MNLNVSQIDQIYEYLEANNIAVLNLSEEEPDDDALLELEDDDDLSICETFRFISLKKSLIRLLSITPLFSAADAASSFRRVSKTVFCSSIVSLPGKKDTKQHYITPRPRKEGMYGNPVFCERRNT